MAGVVYFQVDEGSTECSKTGCPFYAEDGCDMLRVFGASCDEVDYSTLRRCEDGEVVRVK